MTSLIDPSLALDVARRVIGSEPPTTPAERAEVGRSIREACARADAQVRAFTGWEHARPIPTPEILNRSGWVRANLDSLAPIFDRAAEDLPIGTMAKPVLRGAASVQLGLLFGYLSRKVIAQYDLFGGGRFYFVGPNVIEIERRAKVSGDEFRLWVALHEVTHAVQDGGVPWLRSEINAFVDRSLTIMRGGPTPARLLGVVREAVLERRPPAQLLELLLTPEQQRLLRDAQSLMSIVEGHASYVMDELGRSEIPDVDGLRRRVEGARGRALGPEKAMQSVIGLDAKRRQYKDGQAFFEEIVAIAGPAAAKVVWEAPENVPSLDELADPAAWCARVLPPGGP